LKENIEQEIRAQLQVRVQVTVMNPGTLPRSAYKTPLVFVQETQPQQVMHPGNWECEP
jgi:phenylacetate-coenzyme A ligase PaaK-like adenylate-forming protein